MADRVTCINKTDRPDPYDRISQIGGAGWKLSSASAIAAIEARTRSFYVERPAGDRVDVVVATRLGRKYLKTKGDGDQPNNLLALPECQ